MFVVDDPRDSIHPEGQNHICCSSMLIFPIITDLIRLFFFLSEEETHRIDTTGGESTSAKKI